MTSQIKAGMCAQVWIQVEDLSVAKGQELLVLIVHHARLARQPYALPRLSQGGQHGLIYTQPCTHNPATL